jgi:hypothetical protein
MLNKSAGTWCADGRSRDLWVNGSKIENARQGGPDDLVEKPSIVSNITLTLEVREIEPEHFSVFLLYNDGSEFQFPGRLPPGTPKTVFLVSPLVEMILSYNPMIQIQIDRVQIKANEDWQWGLKSKIDYDEAVDLLTGKPEGTFLVRASTSTANGFTISMVQDSSVRHIKVHNVEGGYAINDHSSPCESLATLIQSLQTETMSSAVYGTTQTQESHLLVNPLEKPPPKKLDPAKSAAADVADQKARSSRREAVAIEVAKTEDKVKAAAKAALEEQQKKSTGGRSFYEKGAQELSTLTWADPSSDAGIRLESGGAVVVKHDPVARPVLVRVPCKIAPGQIEVLEFVIESDDTSGIGIQVLGAVDQALLQYTSDGTLRQAGQSATLDTPPPAPVKLPGFAQGDLIRISVDRV